MLKIVVKKGRKKTILEGEIRADGTVQIGSLIVPVKEIRFWLSMLGYKVIEIKGGDL